MLILNQIERQNQMNINNTFTINTEQAIELLKQGKILYGDDNNYYKIIPKNNNDIELYMKNLKYTFDECEKWHNDCEYRPYMANIGYSFRNKKWKLATEKEIEENNLTHTKIFVF